MKVAPIPADEELRLEELRRYHILDTEPEFQYDELTLLARTILNTPISLISFLDYKRQWFKSKQGISLCETSRDVSFCSHAILENDVFVVEDATADPRFFDNPLVLMDPKIRFYAGAPLVVNGQAIGVLCAIDRIPRRLSMEQKDALRAIARLVVRELETRRMTEEALLSSSRMSVLLEGMTSGVMAESEHRQVIFTNSAFCSMFGIPGDPNALIGADMSKAEGAAKRQFAHPEEFLSRLRMLLRDRHPVLGEEIELADGRMVERDYLPLYAGEQYAGHLWVFRDITERKLADRLIDAQRAKLASQAKMVALGQMAGGMAHEINNPLAIIAGRASQLRARAESTSVLPSTVVTTSIERIEATVVRIAKIISAMRTFAEGDTIEPQSLAGIRQIILDTLALCQERLRGGGVEIVVEEIPDLLLRCRPRQISEVLLNLLNNAFDAVRDLPEKWIRIEVMNFPDSIGVAVVDSGHGIPKEHLGKIMIPFFSTKPKVRGVGLGLSVSRGIVESHGGELRVDEASPNTRFLVTLPKAGRSRQVEAA